MFAIQSQIKKAVGTVLILFSLLTILSCASLDPRDVRVELEEAIPAPKETMFYDTLSALGEMTEVYNSKQLKIQCMKVIDDTGSSVATRAEIPGEITEILKSSLTAIGGRVTRITYNPNYVANQINLGLINSTENILLPDVIITGGITEFDRGLETKGKNLDLSAEETFKDRQVGIDYSADHKSSIASIALDLNLIDFRTLVGLPRMQAVNSIKVHKAISERELAFSIFGPTFGFKGTLKKIQGRHEAVRLLVQMSVIQIVGRYLKLPYWNLLPNAAPDPVVIESLKADYYRMDYSQRVAAIQKLLLLNGFIVPLSGVLDTQTNVAIQKFDNRYDPERQNINENIYLNLYFSVPVGLKSTTTAEPIANDLPNPLRNKSDPDEDEINVPAVDTIIDALTPEKASRESAMRGAAGKRDNGETPKGTFDIHIPFALNKYQISNKTLPYLQPLGKALSNSRLKNLVFEIQGHTCNLGREDYNLWLGQKRAEAVKNYLVRNFGFSPNQLRAVGYGQKKPKWSNVSEEGRAQNRRVTILNTLKRYEKRISRPSLKVVANYNRAGKITKILPGTALSSRDNYFLTFTPDQASYVYVFQFDSQNTVTQLFPNPDFTQESNPVVSDKQYRVPGDKRNWLFLDDKKGEEELVVLAYPQPLSEPLRVARTLIRYESKLFPFPNDEEMTTTRGPKGIRQAPDDILFIWRNKFTHID